MRHMYALLGAALLCLQLSGCILAAFLLSGCGGEDADLVIINDSSWPVYAITLESGDQTQRVQNAGGTPCWSGGRAMGWRWRGNGPP